ncbi:MAG: hypothetical protein RSD36_11730 [Terrisporobacter sp.]
MNKKKLFNIILFCGIFLWIIPSALFNGADKRLVLFYYGFHLVIGLLYVIQCIQVFRNKRNLTYEWIVIYLSLVGSVLAHGFVYAALYILGQESSIKLIPWVLVIRVILVIYFLIYRYSCYEKSDFDKEIEKAKELELKEGNITVA